MRSLLQLKRVGGQIEQSRSGKERLFPAVNPVLYVSFFWRAFELAQLLPASSRRASGKRSGVSLP